MKQNFRRLSILLLLVSGAYVFSGCSEEPITGPTPDSHGLEQRHHDAVKSPTFGNGNDNGSNGNDNGSNGNDNGTNGNDNGTNGNDNGTNGNDNGTNGNDNGTNGNDNGTNGNDNGTNGNDNGTNGNDNGTNGNDNGTNGNDNGTNGNDNGTNGNDNGTNGNDNGTNGNDNGSGGTCPDGSTQLFTEMGGSADNDVKYQIFADGCEHFRARVRDLAPFMTYDVMIEGVVVGSLQTDDRGRGELRYQGSLPAGFPSVSEGDQITVGPVSGTFWVSCSNSNCNG
ncbi:MAG: hypothetical protein H6682_15035 [Candidatus Eisenbacteria bacterium]|nr:hypothetical protein [Candidatus Eisenbacteria bacterium]